MELYHGTLKVNIPSILQTGLEPRAGGLTKAYHNQATPIIYASDGGNVRAIVNAITFHMRLAGVPRLKGKKWGEADISKYGAVVVVDGASFSHRPFFEPGKEPPTGLYGGTITKDEDYPSGVEQEDYWSTESVRCLRAMEGVEMLRWLRAHGLRKVSTPEFSPNWGVNAVYLTWKNPLLYSKRAGTFDRSDLDAYDSELAQDLYAIHDSILNNPVRDYDPLNHYSEKRYFNFTFSALNRRLLPAIEKAAPTLLGREGFIDLQIRIAKAELRKAEQFGETEDYATASMHLETAFSTLHTAIDRIRYATREVPQVRSLRPVPAMVRVASEQLEDFWHITTPEAGEQIDEEGLKRGERGYVWCTTSPEAAMEFQEMIGNHYALIHFRWPFDQTVGDEDMTGESMQEVYRMISSDIPRQNIVDIEYGGDSEEED